MLSTLHIKNLRFKSVLGVYSSERAKEQTVLIDLLLNYKYSGTYIDHTELATFIENTVKERKYRVLEDAAEELLSLISTKYPNTASAEIKITKPDYDANYTFAVSVKKDNKNI